MKLAKNWRDILRYAWSVRLMIVAGLFSGVEIVLPLFADCCPRGVFALLSILATVGALVARHVYQNGLDQ